MSMKKLKVFCVFPGISNCGVGYYRQWKPLMVAKENGDIEVEMHGFDWGQSHIPLPSYDELEKFGTWADVLYFGRNDVPQYISLMCGTAKHSGIPAVLDYDDNVQAVRPYNPGYKSFCPNAQAKDWNLKALEEVSALIVSTRNLVDVYGKYLPKDKIYLCPNSLDFKWRDQYLGIDPKIKKKNNEIRIGWAGSSAHWENLKFIEEPLTRIMKKYKNVTFIYTNLFAGLFTDPEIQDRLYTVPFADLTDWPRVLKEMGIDIALAPLVDNLFNRAKSNLRCIEYQAARYPVICSKVEPYLYIKHKKTGLLATERDTWYNYMEELINNEKYRLLLATNGYNQAKKCYNIDTNYKQWIISLNKIVKNHKRSL